MTQPLPIGRGQARDRVVEIRLPVFHALPIRVGREHGRIQHDECVVFPLSGFLFHEFSDGVTGLDPLLFEGDGLGDEDVKFFSNLHSHK